jgi:hypothetical protein
MRFFLAVTLLLAAGCGGNVVVDTATTGSGGAPATTTTTSTGFTGTTTGSGGACPAGVIPSDLKACMSTSDCTQAPIYIDCCGSQQSIGVSVSEVQAFEALEMACNPIVPSCGCPSAPTIAEDGLSAPPDGSILVGCNSGQCTTFVP